MPTTRVIRSSSSSRGTRPKPNVPVGPVTATVRSASVTGPRVPRRPARQAVSGPPMSSPAGPGLKGWERKALREEPTMTRTTTASEPTAPKATADGDRPRWTARIVLCIGVLMIVLDATVTNVALPSIQSDLGFSQSSLAWVVNAYLIAFGGLLLLAGRLGDLLGHTRVFLGGLALFTLASLACGAAQTQETLVAARFIQGIGGALTSAVVLGMIVTMFPTPGDQAKAIGVYGAVASAGGSIGLLAGGVLTQALDWHWIFFVNVPIGIVTAVLAVRLLDRQPGLGLSAGADV